MRPALLRHSSALTLLALLLAVPLALPARDRGADGKFSERRSSHFVLLQDVAIDRYSGLHGSLRFERDVLEILEDAYERVGKVLGLRPRNSVRVAIYDPGVFENRFESLFRFRTAGFFDGAIHVRGDTQIDARLVRTLHHEYVHAALGAAAPSLAIAAWVNEGMAEWFENLAVGKRGLSAGEHAFLVDAERRGALVPLVELGSPGFGHLGSNGAAVAYLKSYAAIDHLARRHGEKSLKRFCDHLVRTGDLDRSLQRVFGLDTARLDEKLRQELRR